MNPTEVTTTGATAWDFLIAMRFPIWIVIILIVVVFCIANADKLLAISGAIAGLFKNISKGANKKYISCLLYTSNALFRKSRNGQIVFL